MIQHTVMFRFRPDVDAATRQAAFQAFKQGIEALPDTIPAIRTIHVGRNVNPAETWDICLTSTFLTLADATAYGAHPAHRAVALALMQHIQERACTDCEI